MNDGEGATPGAELVELRVHGVGGTSPERLLGFAGEEEYPPPARLAGDGEAGFFTRPWPPARRRRLEGYSWGGLTSGRASRSLWLLLLPFSMINAAGYMIDPRPQPVSHPTDRPRRPTSGAVTPFARMQMSIVRLIALAITALFVMWVAALTVDLVAYQCGGQQACMEGRWWMVPFTMEWIGSHPARRMLLGAMVPLLLIGLVVVLSYRSRNRYEEYHPDDPAIQDRGHEFGRDGAALTDRRFWESANFVRRITYAHVGFAIATLGGCYALAVQTMSEDAVMSGPIAVLFLGYALIVTVDVAASGRWTGGSSNSGTETQRAGYAYWLAPLILTGLAFAAGWVEGPASGGGADGIEDVFGRAPLYGVLVVLGGLIALLAVTVARWLLEPGENRVQRALILVVWLVPITAAVAGGRSSVAPRSSVLVVTIVVAIIVAGAAALMARHGRWRTIIVGVALVGAALILLGRSVEKPALQWTATLLVLAAVLPTLAAQLGRGDRWRWAAPLSGASLAVTTLMVAVAGSITRLADFLDRGAAEGAPRIDTIETYGLVSLLIVAALLFVVVGAAMHIVRTRWDLWGPLAKEVADEYAGEPPPEPAADHVDCIDGTTATGNVVREALRWRSLSAAARDVDVFVSMFALIPLAAGVLAVTRLIVTHAGAWSDLTAAFEQPPVGDEWSWFVTAATWLASLFPIAAVVAMRLSVSNSALRRGLGIAWDVLTFWPRRFHPLGPPAYSERAVPELKERISQLTRGSRDRVMLTAHSQGGIIAVASLAWLTANGDAASRVMLVTHGNPAGRLYRRFFPGYFGGGLMRWLRSQLHDGDGWLNLYRLTDPIGDAVFTGPDEDIGLPLPDRTTGDRPLPDPPSKWRFSLDDCPAAGVHSGYLDQPVAVRLLDQLAERLDPRA